MSLKFEKSGWWEMLSETNKEKIRLVRKMTNWQLTRWNRDGCPGIAGDITKLREYTELKKK